MGKELAFWNRRAAGYDKQSGIQFTKAYEETIAMTRKYLKPEYTVLDFACGTGITTVKLAKDVDLVDAIDYSEEMLAILREKAEKSAVSNIRTHAGTLEDASLPMGHYDVVMAFNILCYMKEDGKAIRRIHELLKPGGIFLSATDCHGEQKGFKPMLFRMLSGLGMIPFLRQLTESALDEKIKNGGFTVLEKKELSSNPPNLFIAAMKRL
jgi:ubiquinone/menaquinone biosynthesis C-methylase UbiE